MTKLSMIMTKLKVDHPAPFESFFHVISFYNNHNPARAKRKNLLEPEGGTSEIQGYCPTDLWAAIRIGIVECMKHWDHDHKWSFLWRYIVRETRPVTREEEARGWDGRFHVTDIAERLGRSPRTVYRYLDKIEEDLTRQFVRLELINQPDDR